MEFPQTAAMVGAFLIILQQFFMMNTGTHRVKADIGVGYGTDRDLERKSRRHGNLAENAAIFVIVLALTEGLIGSGPIITGFAGAFIFARLCHAIGFMSTTGSHATKDGPKFFAMFRAVGATLTGLIGLGLGFCLAYQLAKANGLLG